jgi:hypothetical protein
MEPSSKKRKKRPPAKTVEERENQLIAHAAALAEKQLLNGTATSQVMTHFLKLGTMKAKLEMEKLRKENELLEAKAEIIASEKRTEELYIKAISAMRKYSGHPDEGEVIDD